MSVSRKSRKSRYEWEPVAHIEFAFMHQNTVHKTLYRQNLYPWGKFVMTEAIRERQALIHKVDNEESHVDVHSTSSPLPSSGARVIYLFLAMLILCALLATAAAVAEVSVSPFLGLYSDPNHPACYRKVLEKTPSGKLFVYGQDNKGGGGISCNIDDRTQLNAWGPCPAFANMTHITVDLSCKSGPADLTGTWDAVASRIVWADGNYWQHKGHKHEVRGNS